MVLVHLTGSSSMISVRYHIKKKPKTFLVGSVQLAKLYTYDDHLSKSNIHSLVLFVLLMHLFCTQKIWVNGQFLLAIFS